MNKWFKKGVGVALCCNIAALMMPVSAFAYDGFSQEIVLQEPVINDYVEAAEIIETYSENVTKFGGSYYCQLTDSQQEAYNILSKSFRSGLSDGTYNEEKNYYLYDIAGFEASFDTLNQQTYVELFNTWCDDFKIAFITLVYDNPELVWLDGRGYSFDFLFTRDSQTGHYTATGKLILTPSSVSDVTSGDMDSLIKAADEQIRQSYLEEYGFSFSINDEVKAIKSIHDYLCNTIQYNDEAAHDGYDDTQSIAYQTAYSAFEKCNGDEDLSTVCAGYAKGFKVLCDYYGIPCVVISGQSKSSSTATPGNHAWNETQVEGNWYGVDCTWDDQTAPKETNRIFYDFFLAGSESVDTYFGKMAFSDSHIASGDVTKGQSDILLAYPELNSEKYVSDIKVLSANATPGDGHVYLEWDKVTGATEYSVTYGYDTNYTLASDNIKSNSYDVNGLINEYQYRFLIRARVDGKWSSAMSVYARPSANKEAKPKNIKTTAGDGKVTLSWDKVDGATAYAVAVYQNGKYDVRTDKLTATEYTVTGLTNGTEYQFLVQAKVGNKWSRYTTADHVKCTPKGAASTKPQNIVATAGDGEVTLSWDKVDGATAYAVAVYQNGKYDVRTDKLTETEYTVTGLTNGTDYQFLVQAKVGNKWSRYSTADLIKCAPASPADSTKPSNIRVTGINERIFVRWDYDNDATAYAVSIYQNGRYKVVDDNITDAFYFIDGLENGKEYSILVQAKIDDKWSKFTTSDLIKATPVDNTTEPKLLLVRFKTNKENPDKYDITVYWDKVTGSEEYHVTYKSVYEGIWSDAVRQLRNDVYSWTGSADKSLGKIVVEITAYTGEYLDYEETIEFPSIDD